MVVVVVERFGCSGLSSNTQKERQGLRNLCIFFATVYVKIWTLAHVAVKAPNEDLKLLKTLQQYKSVDKKISKATSKKCWVISGIYLKNW